MKYKPRPGIVMTKICGTHFLIPTRPASVYCPHVLRLSFLTTVCWEMLAHEKSMEEIYNIYRILSRRTPEESQDRVDRLFSDLYSKGFLISAEDAS